MLERRQNNWNSPPLMLRKQNNPATLKNILNRLRSLTVSCKVIHKILVLICNSLSENTCPYNAFYTNACNSFLQIWPDLKQPNWKELGWKELGKIQVYWVLSTYFSSFQYIQKAKSSSISPTSPSKNSTDSGAWRPAVPGVTKSRTRLSN